MKVVPMIKTGPSSLPDTSLYCPSSSGRRWFMEPLAAAILFFEMPELGFEFIFFNSLLQKHCVFGFFRRQCRGQPTHGKHDKRNHGGNWTGVAYNTPPRFQSPLNP